MKSDAPTGVIGEAEALEIGAFLTEHKAGDVTVLDMRPLDFWTDFFAIGTVRSDAHLAGLERHIKDWAAQGDYPLRRSGKPGPGDEWRLCDLGSLVVHLMSPRARAFYELERLWQDAPVLYKG